jgi:hypothetical protein
MKHDLLKIRREIPDARTAVYTPYLVSDQKEKLAYDVLTLLGRYVVRRKWVQRRMVKKGYKPDFESVNEMIRHSQKTGKAPEDSMLGRDLLECASELALYGDTLEVAEGIRTLFERGINIVVGSPVKDCEEQVMALGRCVGLATSS